MHVVTITQRKALEMETVPVLREIVSRMVNVKGLHKMRKADLIDLIIDARAVWEQEAYAEEAERAKLRSPNFTGLTTMTRMDNYNRQNGGGVLTARQQRRVVKKYKRALSKGHNPHNGRAL